MRKTIHLGKVAFCGTRRINEVEVDVSYMNENGKDKFAVSGKIWNGSHGDIITGGQCLDTIKECLEKDNSTKLEFFNKIYGLWERNHLNDMDASANDEQRNAVNEYLKTNKYDYDKVCEYLRNKNLFEVEVNGKKCKYGHEWYYREISDEDKKLIGEVMNYA